jgi:mono/diheme cytochrome c family protein
MKFYDKNEGKRLSIAQREAGGLVEAGSECFFNLFVADWSSSHLGAAGQCPMRRSRIAIFAAVMPCLAAFAAGDPIKGKDLFITCAGCHNVENDQRKMGPSLRSLFGKVTLRNGKRATEENVREIVLEGYNRMPPFRSNLTAAQADDLMAYLLTLKGKPVESAGSPEAAAFQAYCISCHNPALRGERGPDLRGLFKREKLASGDPLNEKTVRTIIDEGHANAPAYKDWIDDPARQRIVEYLKSH